MTPHDDIEIRLECLKLAMSLASQRPAYSSNVGFSYLQSSPPTAPEVLAIATKFESYLLKGQPVPEPAKPRGTAEVGEAIQRLAREEARKVMGENHDP